MELTEKEARNILRNNQVDFCMDDRPPVEIVEALGLLIIEPVPERPPYAILGDDNV